MVSVHNSSDLYACLTFVTLISNKKNNTLIIVLNLPLSTTVPLEWKPSIVLQQYVFMSRAIKITLLKESAHLSKWYRLISQSYFHHKDTLNFCTFVNSVRADQSCEIIQACI